MDTAPPNPRRRPPSSPTTTRQGWFPDDAVSSVSCLFPGRRSSAAPARARGDDTKLLKFKVTTMWCARGVLLQLRRLQPFHADGSWRCSSNYRGASGRRSLLYCTALPLVRSSFASTRGS